MTMKMKATLPIPRLARRVNSGPRESARGCMIKNEVKRDRADNKIGPAQFQCFFVMDN
jgi:hypothetical protein